MAKGQLDRLAMESSAAIKAGMSYGYWKAAQKREPIKKKEELPEGWLVCEWCGKWYKPKTKRPRKYCESYCQLEASKQKKREREKMKYEILL